MEVTCSAPECSNPIPDRGDRGPVATYCSTKCRMRVYRIRTGQAAVTPGLLAAASGLALVAAEFIGAIEASKAHTARLDAALRQALADLAAGDSPDVNPLLNVALDHVQTRTSRGLDWQKAIYAAEDAATSEQQREQLLELDQLNKDDVHHASALHSRCLTFRGKVRDAIDAELRTTPHGQLGQEPTS